jgi:hypothetical protein
MQVHLCQGQKKIGSLFLIYVHQLTAKKAHLRPKRNLFSKQQRINLTLHKLHKETTYTVLASIYPKYNFLALINYDFKA